MKSGFATEFIFHPTVFVEHIDRNLFTQRAGMFLTLLGDDKKVGVADKPADTGKAIDAVRLGEKKEDQSKEDNNSNENDNILGQPTKLIKEAVNDVEAKDKILGVLEKLGTSDITNFEFQDQMVNVVMQNGALPLHISVLSAQKKANVFYIQEQITFRDVDVTVNGGTKTHVGKFEVNSEIFCFSRGTDAYLVQVILPRSLPERTILRGLRAG